MLNASKKINFRTMHLHKLLSGFRLLHGVDEHVEEALHVGRSCCVFRMELNAKSLPR